jgi:hypothetical protein
VTKKRLVCNAIYILIGVAFANAGWLWQQDRISAVVAIALALIWLACVTSEEGE